MLDIVGYGRVSKDGLNITLKPEKVPSMVIGMSQGHFKYVASDHVCCDFTKKYHRKTCITKLY